jgi:hypothetical protein
MEKLIREILSGKQVGTLYHYTSYKSLIAILESNKLHSTQYDYTKNVGVSFTTVKSPVHGAVGIVVDGDDLSNNYKVSPMSFGLTPIPDEHEERVLTKEIKNIRRYIKKVIVYPNLIGSKKEWIDMKDEVEKVLSHYNIPIEENLKIRSI